MALRAILVAAGRGTRAGGAPKQFAELAGRTVLWHALRPFAANARIDSVRAVVAPEMTAAAARSLGAAAAHAEILPAGGATRAESVRGGLQGLHNDDWAVVHDAARPCLRDTALARLLAAAERDAVGGLLALSLGDALKEEADGRARRTLLRAGKYLAQTPQMFRVGTLRAALSECEACGDEAEAMERAGYAPLLVAGDAENIKITRGEDFALAAAILSARAAAGE